MSGAEHPAEHPLQGYTVGVTADRRKDELALMLRRRGARVMMGPAIRITPVADDRMLLDATIRCIEEPPDDVIATTGIGFRGWMEAADGWGLGEPLRDVLGGARILARGPKVRGAVRAAGLVDAWSPESESTAEVLSHLLGEDLRGRRIVVQLHGDPQPDLVSGLRAAGAEVTELAVYRWELPEDPAPLTRLVEATAAGGLDAVTFTSAPAVLASLSVAEQQGWLAAVLERFQQRSTLACCVGPVTAAPLARLGVPVLVPQRYRLGALVREVSVAMSERDPALRVAGRTLIVRGHGVSVDGDFLAVPPTQLAVLRALAAEPGRVVARRDLLGVLVGADDHALDVAVARLRASLGEARMVQTVVKRGYRLSVEAEAGAA